MGRGRDILQFGGGLPGHDRPSGRAVRLPSAADLGRQPGLYAQAKSDVAALYQRSAVWRSANAGDKADLSIASLSQAIDSHSWNTAAAAMVLMIDARKALAAEQEQWLGALAELLDLNRRDSIAAIKGTAAWLHPQPKDTTPGHLRSLKEYFNDRFYSWFEKHYGPVESDVAWRKWAEENAPKPAAKPDLNIYDEEDDDDGEVGDDEGFPFGASGTERAGA